MKQWNTILSVRPFLRFSSLGIEALLLVNYDEIRGPSPINEMIVCVRAEIEPAFPYRDVTIRRDASIRDAYEFLDEIGRSEINKTEIKLFGITSLDPDPTSVLALNTLFKLFSFPKKTF